MPSDKEQIIELHDEDYHSYVFVTGKGQQVCRFEIDNVYTKEGAMWGEVTIMYLFDGDPQAPIVSFQRLNLLTDKRPGIELLTNHADMWPWEQMYERVKGLTVENMRSPMRPVSLKEGIEAEPFAPFLIEPFVLGQGVSLLFGPGGTGKSMIALAMAIGVASGQTIFGRKPTHTGNVLYLDYEDDERTHKRRLLALLEGLGMTVEDLEHDILWVKPSTSVSKMRRQLRTYMRDHDPSMVIVDSVGLARGGDAMGSEETIKLFFALSQLPCSVLAIDHMTKEDVRGEKMVTPYGSIYTVNSVRLAWAVKRADASNETVTYLNMKQTKRNNVAYHEPVGAEVRFTNDMMEFGDSKQPVLAKVQLDLTDMWWQMEPESAIDKAIDYLEREGPTTAPVIARSIGVKVDSLSKKLRTYEGDKVKRVSGSSKPIVWGLNHG